MKLTARISNLRRELVNSYNISEEIQQELISIYEQAKTQDQREPMDEKKLEFLKAFEVFYKHIN